MYRGVHQPTSNSASRSTDTGTSEKTQQPSTIGKRRGQAQNEAVAEPKDIGETTQHKSILARRRLTDQPALSLPQRSGELQYPSSELKSPAYLQGKNPYGQVLDKIKHPYRKPRDVATTNGPPSQASSSVGLRPRTSDALQFKRRPTPTEPQRAVPTSDSQSPRRPPTSLSVQAARNFFESRVSQHRSGDPLPPSGPAGVTQGVEGKHEAQGKQAQIPSQRQPIRTPSPTKAPTPERRESNDDLSLTRPPPESIQADSFQRVNPLGQNTARSTARSSFAKGAAVSQKSDVSEDQELASAIEHEAIDRERPANTFIKGSRDQRLHERGTLGDSSELGGVSHAPHIAPAESRQTVKRRDSDDNVRHRSTRKSLSAAGTEIATAPGDPGGHPRSWSTSSSRDVRGAVEEHRRSTSKQRGRCASRTVPLIKTDASDDSVRRAPGQRTTKSTFTDRGRGRDDHPDEFNKSIHVRKNVRRRVEEIAARGLSHDGSSSDPILSRHSAAAGPISIANVGVELGYYSIDVPDDVDWRGAYGRRKTQDFGFPGARIKPHRWLRTSMPLNDPGNWIRRICGHFSYMGKGEHPDFASKKKCRQCSAMVPLSEPQPSRHQGARKRAATDSSTSSSSTSKKTGDNVRNHNSRRRQHHPYLSIPNDKCGDRLTRTLGYGIDAILEEHTNSSQDYNSIKHDRPSLAQIRRVLENPTPQCQVGNACHTSSQDPYTQQVMCQPACQHYQHVCQPVCGSQICEWQPPSSYVAPKAAEKLNVGSPGLLKPNINDSLSSLRESINTVPELVDLVNSAADDLGIDLDIRPSAKEDEVFRKALVAGTPVSGSFRQQDPLEAREHQYGRDTWLQQSRRHVTELSEAQTQLMEELDSITGDQGVQPQEFCVSEPAIDPIQQVFGEMSKVLSMMSSLLRSNSVGSTTEEIPRMIDQHIDESQVSGALARITTQSRRMSVITQHLQNMEGVLPGETRDLLEVALAGFPATMDSIAMILETLPAFGIESTSVIKVQPKYEPKHEPEAERYKGHTDTPSSDHTVAEPVTKPQECIAELECRLRKVPMQIGSPDYNGHVFTTPTERTITSGPNDIEPTTHTMLEQRPKDEGTTVERVLSRRGALQPPRKPTLVWHGTSERSSLSSDVYEKDEESSEPKPDVLSAAELVATWQQSCIAQRPPIKQSEIAFSCVSSEPEETTFDVQHGLVKAEPDISLQQPTTCKSCLDFVEDNPEPPTTTRTFTDQSTRRPGVPKTSSPGLCPPLTPKPVPMPPPVSPSANIPSRKEIFQSSGTRMARTFTRQPSLATQFIQPEHVNWPETATLYSPELMPNLMATSKPVETPTEEPTVARVVLSNESLSVPIRREPPRVQSECEGEGPDRLESFSVYSCFDWEHTPEPELKPTRRTMTGQSTTSITGLTTSSSEPQVFSSMEEIQARAASQKTTFEQTSTSTWSTKFLKNRKLSPTAVSRKPNQLSHHNMRRPSLSSQSSTTSERTFPTDVIGALDEKLFAPIMRQATVHPVHVSRQATAMQKASNLLDPLRQPTGGATTREEYRPRFATVDRMSQSYVEPEVELDSQPQEMLVEDEPLVDYSTPVPALLSSRKSATISRIPIRVPVEKYDEPTPVKRRASTRIPRPFTTDPHAPMQPPVATRVQPGSNFEPAPCSPSSSTIPSSIAVPQPRSTIPRDTLDFNYRVSRMVTTLQEKDRRQSNPVLGIAAPPSEAIQRDLKPTPLAKTLRDTPSWTNPGTYTPSQKLKRTPLPKKRALLGRNLHPQRKPPAVQRFADNSEPRGNRPFNPTGT